MADAKTVLIDPKDHRIDGRLMRRIWRLAKPYWRDSRHWKSWTLMIFTLCTGPLWAIFNYWIAHLNAEQVNAAVAKDESAFVGLFWLLFWLGLATWVYRTIETILEKLMAMQWFRWMTEWMVTKYLDRKTYYDIAIREDIDNPDERIQSNVEPFTTALLGLPSRVMGTIVAITLNTVLINQINSAMTVFVMVYSLVAVTVQFLTYIPMIRMNFDVVAANADLRYGLLRVRDNAEPIAFFRGEEPESAQVSSRLWRLVRFKMRVIYYTTFVTGGTSHALTLVWSIAPLFLVYPLFFNGQIEYGVIAMATTAAMNLRMALTQIDDYLPFLAELAPRTVRLAQIIERWDELSDEEQEGPRISLQRGGAIRLDDVSFETPGGEQQLVQHLNLEIGQGESLIIIGQTGVGKSSLLRAMAGLWTRGSGTMTMPDTDATMFVPQKPYMILGDLRSQLLYPNGDPGISEEEIQAVLERVCLPGLIEKNGGLDAERDWSKVLSLGEQQRISFARIILSKPQYVFLDEATSAMDIPTESKVYETLQETGCTFVSVGHRQTILKFHDRALNLAGGGKWKLVGEEDIVRHKVLALGAARRRMQKAQISDE